MSNILGILLIIALTIFIGLFVYFNRIKKPLMGSVSLAVLLTLDASQVKKLTALLTKAAKQGIKTDKIVIFTNKDKTLPLPDEDNLH